MNNKINSAPENQENPQKYFKSVLGENSPDYLDLNRMVTETSSKISWVLEKIKKFKSKIKNMNNKINSAPEKKETPQEYFKSVLGENSPDYLDLDRMVRETDSKISWENLEKFTKVQNGKVEGIYWKGELSLGYTKITSLGKLKKVGGNLNLYGASKLTDLGELEEVGLDLESTFRNLDLEGTNITSLGKLKKVDGYINLNGVSTLIDLGELEQVGSDLDLRWTSIKTLGNLKKVWGSLDLKGVSSLMNLGKLDYVRGLRLVGTNITSLGKLKKINRYLDIDGVSTLTDLGELEEVGGDLNLRGTSIKTLGKLKKVNGSLILNGVSTLIDLGELEQVGGDYYDALGNLDLKLTNLKSSGKLKKVNGNLELRGSNLIFQIEVFKKIMTNNLFFKTVNFDKYIGDYLISSKTFELLDCQITYGSSIPFSFEHKESFKSIFGKEENRGEKLQNVCLGIAKEVINRYLESLEAKKQEFKNTPTRELKDEIAKDYTEKKLFFEEMFGPRITGEIFSQFLKKEKLN